MIDHLVYATKDLPLTLNLLQDALGTTFSTGGCHPNRGTLNHLLKIGPNTYLELLAVDPDNTNTPPPRWMGIDLLPKNTTGRLTRWARAVTSALPPEQLNNINFEAGSRRTTDGSLLEWRLSDPGSSPLISAAPFYIDWLGQPSPAERLPQSGCRLLKLTVSGPDVSLQPLADELPQLIVEKTNSPARIEAIITGPAGTVILV